MGEQEFTERDVVGTGRLRNRSIVRKEEDLIIDLRVKNKTSPCN